MTGSMWVVIALLGLGASPQKVEAKTAEALSQEVGQLIGAGKSAEALKRAEDAWAQKINGPELSYNAACAAARLGKKDESFTWLERSVAEGMDDADGLAKDTDLVSLRADPRFDALTRKAAANKEAKLAAEHPKDAKLQHAILALVKEDQAARQAAVDSRMKDPKALAAVAAIDQKTTAFMKKTVEAHGWPGNALVGKTAAKGAWLLVQHADKDPAFQEKCLGLMAKAVKAHDADGQSFAYLTDRVRLAKGEKQLYGTQFAPVHGKWTPRPIEDPDHVDARRKEMGLQPLADYLAFAAKMYGPAPADPPAPKTPAQPAATGR